jgi:N utilization substance protein B
VLNEAVDLCKMFGAEDGHKYINGVLDKVAQETRKVEIAGTSRVTP